MMTEKNSDREVVSVPLADVVEVFRFLVEVNDFLHQPANYTPDRIHAFSDAHYPSCHKLVYETVRNWIPDDVMTELEEEF